MSDQHEQADMRQMEAALRALRPAAADIPRDELLFRAGQASVARPRWPGILVAAVGGLLVGGVGTGIFVHRSLKPERDVIYVRVREQPHIPDVSPKKKSPTPPSPTQLVRAEDMRSIQMAGYVGLRNRVIRWGMDALPPVRGVEEDTNRTETPVLRVYEAVPQVKQKSNWWQIWENVP